MVKNIKLRSAICNTQLNSAQSLYFLLEPIVETEIP